MKISQSFAIIFAGTLLLAGCKKYLEEEPRKQASVKTVSQLEALVDNALQFAYEENYTAVNSTDDYEITKDLYKNNPASFNLNQLQYYVFNVDGIIGAINDPLWNNEFKKIFTANLILENIDDVTGDDVTRQRVKADAHFIRACSNWTLVNYYCAPYSSANMNTPGLPLKQTTDYTESLQRTTLKETYDFILADVVEAQKVANDDVDPRRAWRVSQKAISAFLSRYYLFTGDYEKCTQESDKALSSSAVKLVDFSTLAPGNSVTYNNPAVTLHYTELQYWNAAKFLYWPEFYYTRYVYNAYQFMIPSSALLALYDQQNDLRFKDLIIPNGGRRLNVINPPTYRYTFFNDGAYTPAGFTMSEVLLNKAEALARQGDAGGAMTSVNILRQKRMSTYIALTATGKDDAIKKVLEERRREMPFVLRWCDIRRFSVNDYAGDDITVTRDFFEVSTTGVDVNTPKTYTLDSKRLLVPISGAEIDASKGQITQNPY